MKARVAARSRHMGDSTGSMVDALFPRTKQSVLSLMFGQPDRAFGMTELIALVGAGSGAVQRELDKFAASGLVTATVTGRQKRYQANRAAPIFDELRGIVEKTAGVADALRMSLAPLASRIRLAILYGSVAKDTDRAASDIDVLIVADDLSLEDVFTALEPAERRLGRRVSPTVYTSKEFAKRRASGQPFLTKVLSGKRVVLLGNEDELGPTR